MSHPTRTFDTMAFDSGDVNNDDITAGLDGGFAITTAQPAPVGCVANPSGAPAVG